MRARALLSFAVVSAGIALFSACSDASLTAPRHAGQSAALLGEVVEPASTVGNVLMSPLHRRTALDQPVTWSFVAGPNGAVSSNWATGLTIAVPRGALGSNVTITVTAVAGTAVAYAFEPHGLQFAKDVVLTQSLRATNLGVLNLVLPQGGHFEGSAPVFSGPFALVNETSPGWLNLLQNSMSFPIRHFSGWIAGSGRTSTSGTSETDGQ